MIHLIVLVKEGLGNVTLCISLCWKKEPSMDKSLKVQQSMNVFILIDLF